MAAWQAWVLLAGAVGAAVYLFLLKVRPRRLRVPALQLWGRVLDDPRELTLWERIRRAVSLAITAAIALALVLAFVRPARVAGATSGSASHGRVTLVLDSSWSMLARTRGGGTRWTRASPRREAWRPRPRRSRARDHRRRPDRRADHRSPVDRGGARSVAPGGGAAAGWPAVGGSDAVYFLTDGAPRGRATPA